MTESTQTPADSGDQPSAATPSEPAALRIRYRIRFAKQGLLRWISHRDLARLWERLLRRASFKLSMTEGFHPKPRVGFPSALALGVESLDEVVEIELSEDLSPQEVLRRMVADDQPGLTVHRVCKLPEGYGKARLERSDYTISTIESADREAVANAIKELLAKETVTVERKKKPMTVSVSSQILRLELSDHSLNLSLAASDSASLRPGDVLDLLGLGDWIELGSLIVRDRVVLQRDLESSDPEVMALAADSGRDSSADPTPSTHSEHDE